MTFAAVTLLGMTMGQPLGPDYYPMNSRTIKLPIEYKKNRKDIRQVLLYVAKNGENTWYQEAFVTPDKDSFVYVAKDDGIYWFKMVIEDLKGNKDPADLTRDPPDLKMVIDTAAPQVRVTNARRNGEEIIVEWAVEDKFPNDAETKVHFRATENPKTYWQEVTLPANSRTGVKFPCGTSEGITVRITAVDIAGNRTEITKDFPAAGASTSLKEPEPPYPAPVSDGKGNGQKSLPTYRPGHERNDTGASMGAVVPPPTDITPPGPVAPGPKPPAPPAGVGVSPAPTPPAGPVGVSPTPSPPAPTPPISAPPAAPITPYTPPATGHSGTPTGGPTPLPTVDPKAAPSGTLPAAGSAPTGAWSGAPSPTVEVTRAQVINYPRFDLGFDLEQRGPSGISRVDLWVTRDEGRTWHKWSQHDGKGGAVRVVLDVRENSQLEGNYGFRLVPVSGAGLSEREPVAGDAPDMRVVLDVTPPQLDLFPPVSDPNTPDTLVLQWRATDRNFGDDPITLEWSDSPTGPWKPVVSNGNDPIVQATAINTPVVKRLANTGQYGWRIPAGVPARVYLKATARDAAGNVKEVVTREPILVDLTKPRAKINGIVPSIAPRP